MRVYAGQDPVTGRDRYLSKTIKGTDRAARKRAEKTLTQLQAEVDKQRVPETSVPLSRALDEWLRTVEIEDTTRRTYVGYIGRTIKPALGSISIDKVSARNLEALYSELRRCRLRCDGRPFIERHRVGGEPPVSETGIGGVWDAVSWRRAWDATDRSGRAAPAGAGGEQFRVLRSMAPATFFTSDGLTDAAFTAITAQSSVAIRPLCASTCLTSSSRPWCGAGPRCPAGLVTPRMYRCARSVSIGPRTCAAG